VSHTLHIIHCLPTTNSWCHSQKHNAESPVTPGYLPSVGCWQSTVSWSRNDLERWTECSKPSWGQLGGTSCELQEPGQLFLCETGDHSPKPPHDLIEKVKPSQPSISNNHISKLQDQSTALASKHSNRFFLFYQGDTQRQVLYRFFLSVKRRPTLLPPTTPSP